MIAPMSKRMATTCFAAVAVVLVAFAYVVAILSQGRPDIPLSRLLAPSPGGPAEQWVVQVDHVTSRFGDLGTATNVERIWSPKGAHSPTIHETVFRYGNPLSARLQYARFQPSRRDQYPDVKEGRRGYQSKSADDSQTVCGTGDTNHCQIWLYWARYGQYILQIAYIADDPAIGESDFIDYFSPMEREFTHVL